MKENKTTVPISGRVSEKDYSFLMEYPIPGKVTASEKLRYVVSFFRTYHESLGNYEDILLELSRLLEPSRKRIKQLELESGSSSELVDRIMLVAPELLGFMITAKFSKEEDRSLASLVEFEERLATTLLGLLESLLRMGLTSQSPTYNHRLLHERLGIIQELVALKSNS